MKTSNESKSGSYQLTTSFIAILLFHSFVACYPFRQIHAMLQYMRWKMIMPTWWKPTGSEVEWAECSLIIGTGHWVQVFLAWFSVAQSVRQGALNLLEIRFQRPWVRFLHSAEVDNLSPFDSKICLSVPEHQNEQQQTCISPDPGAKGNWQWGRVGWVPTDHQDGLLILSFFSLIRWLSL